MIQDPMGVTGSLGRTPKDYFISTLRSVGLVDIGHIKKYEPSTGKAQVIMFNVIEGMQQVLYGVEVLFPGNAANGLRGDIINAPCIVFYPRAVVRSFRDNKVSTTATPYDSSGAKCIPLSTCSNKDVRIGFDASGHFYINTDAFRVSVSEDNILFANSDNSIQYMLSETGLSRNEGYEHETHGEDGSINLYYEMTDGKVAYRMSYKPDGTYTVQRYAYEAWTPEQHDNPDLYTNYTWTDTYTADGKREMKQVASNGDVLNDIVFASDGTLTISQTKAKNTITLSQNGKVTIKSKGDTTIEATGKISLQAAGKNLYTIWNSILTKLNSTFSTQGSPGSHTVVPNQLQQEQTDLGAAMQ